MSLMADAETTRNQRTHTTIVVPTDVRSRVGGIATFVRSFIRHAPDNFEIALVSLTAGEETIGQWHPAEVSGRGIELFPVGRIADPNRRASIPLAMRFAIGVLRYRTGIAARTEGSVLQFHRPGSDVPHAFPGSAGQIRVLHTFSGQLLAVSGDSRWRMLPSALGVIEHRSIRRSDFLIAVNERAAEDYRHRHPGQADRIRFIPNWVELDRFNPAVAAARSIEARRQLGLTESDRVIVVVGRIAKEKQPGLALEAFASVARTRQDVHLVYVGGGPLRQVVEKQAAGYGLTRRVHFVGVVDHGDIPNFLSMAEVTLITSANETGPTTCLEALACGTPVVGTPVGQIPTWIKDGRNGYVVEARPSSIAQGICGVLDGDRDRLRGEAAASAKPFDSRRILGLVYDLHREAARRSRGEP